MALPGFGYREAGGDRGFGQIDRPCQGDDLRHRHLDLGTGANTGTGPGPGPGLGTGPGANTGSSPGLSPGPNTGVGLGSARHLPRSRGQPLSTSQQPDDVASGQVQIGPVRYPAITTSSIRARTVLPTTASTACTSLSAVGGRAPANSVLAIPTSAQAVTTSGRAITADALASAPVIIAPAIPTSPQGTVHGRLVEGGAAALPDPIPGRQVTTVAPGPR
ncbi:hypothetical protein [Microtetraspora malaysiensis]|uniref:Uncharacterized protein n=1 Tax=Microtetraspora malaysiensis TaxID=161358 RepID=A0ABW6SM38_9ACTN